MHWLEWETENSSLLRLGMDHQVGGSRIKILQIGSLSLSLSIYLSIYLSLCKQEQPRSRREAHLSIYLSHVATFYNNITG